jgi:hypothetical protein
MKPGYSSVVVSFKNALKLSYQHLHFLKFFSGLYPRPPLKEDGNGLGRAGQRGRYRLGGMQEEEIRDGRKRRKEREFQQLLL